MSGPRSSREAGGWNSPAPGAAGAKGRSSEEPAGPAAHLSDQLFSKQGHLRGRWGALRACEVILWAVTHLICLEQRRLRFRAPWPAPSEGPPPPPPGCHLGSCPGACMELSRPCSPAVLGGRFSDFLKDAPVWESLFSLDPRRDPVRWEQMRSTTLQVGRLRLQKFREFYSAWGFGGGGSEPAPPSSQYPIKSPGKPEIQGQDAKA